MGQSVPMSFSPQFQQPKKHPVPYPLPFGGAFIRATGKLLQCRSSRFTRAELMRLDENTVSSTTVLSPPLIPELLLLLWPSYILSSKTICTQGVVSSRPLSYYLPPVTLQNTGPPEPNFLRTGSPQQHLQDGFRLKETQGRYGETVWPSSPSYHLLRLTQGPENTQLPSPSSKPSGRYVHLPFVE